MFRNLLLGVAIFGLGWGASFGAGVAFGRRNVTPTVQAAAAPRGEFAPGGGQVQPGQGGSGGTARGLALGVVDRVDGQILSLTTANNQQIKVALTDQTLIVQQAPGAVEDLTAGVRVTVQPQQGQPAANGTVTAASITVIPEGLAASPRAEPPGQAGQQRAPGQPGQRGQPRPSG